MSALAPPERLFFAVALPDEARAAIADRAPSREEGMPGRVVPPENWHLTVRFLGELDAAARDAVLGSVEQAPLGPPFPLRLGGWGAFPRPARASVLWLGVRAGEEPLRRLAERVEDAVAAAGLPRERRPFAAHLTLTRLRQPQDVRPLLDRLPDFEAALTVHELVLYRSALGQGPPRYDAVARIPLH